MASSSSPSPFENQNEMNSMITQEELFAFHNIDRQLFSRLVFSLRRDPVEAIQVAAFWLWLERMNMAQYVATILTYPDYIFGAILEETLLCLRVAESETFFFPNNNLFMLEIIVGKHMGVGDKLIKFFHDKRTDVLLGITHFTTKVCLKAFQDLIQYALESHQHSKYPKNDSVVTNFRQKGLLRSPPNQPRLPPIYEENHSSSHGVNLGVPLLRGNQFNVSNFNQRNDGASSSHNNNVPMLPINNLNYGLETFPQRDFRGDQFLNHNSFQGVGLNPINRVINNTNYGLDLIRPQGGLGVPLRGDQFINVSSNYHNSFQKGVDDNSSSYRPMLHLNSVNKNNTNYVLQSTTQGNLGVHFRGDQFVNNYHNSFQSYGGGSSSYVPVVNSTNYGLEIQPKEDLVILIDQLISELGMDDEDPHHQLQRFQETPNLVPIEERTIFLTFSKGYPIDETELRDFFNRSFGNVVEALHMQEVSRNEQSLYARLVVCDAKAMEAILTKKGKSKFSIKGKHVWARKYVHKNSSSPPSSPNK